MNTKKKMKYWIDVVIGLGFMLLFPLIPPLEPLTRVGMSIIGVFIGMVYMWSTVDGIWPELVGLVIIALSGYVEGTSGYAAVKAVFAGAFSSETVIGIMLAMILFGSMSAVGIPKYIAYFFLRQKIVEKRPYVLLFVFLICSYVLSGLTAALVSMLVLWPVALEICKKFHYEKGDKFFYVIICGIYFASTVGQPMLPFKGAILAIHNSFVKAFGLQINNFNYIVFNIIMALIMFLAYLLIVRFLIRPDLSALKAITVDDIMKEGIEKMDFRQKVVSAITAVSILLLLLPAVLPATLPGISFLNSLGLVGITSILIAVSLVFRDENNRPLINLKEYAKNSFSWDIYFQVAAALYIATALTSDATGVKPFIVQSLSPILGQGSGILFIFLMILLSMLITNVANNMAIGIVFMSVLAAFAEQYADINMAAMAVTISMSVFMALLTPAASPYCGMLHARKDLVETGDIMKIFIPVAIAAVIVYTVIGYPLASVLF